MTMTMAKASAAMPDPRRLVDLARYPVDRFDAPAGAALLADCRARMAQQGVMALAGFLPAEAVAAMRDEALALAPKAHPGEKRHNVYLIDDDPALPPAHPRNRPERTQISTVADDLIGSASPLRALYDWPALRGFLAAVLGKPALHPYADPLASLNVTVGYPGEQLGWHFDNADFATTLMLQGAEAGGEFEYCPNIRNAGDQGYGAVADILDGRYADVRRLPIEPGTLVLFRGRHSLHRVTPIAGGRPRLMAVLSYDAEPGVTLSERTRLTFYGRTG